MKIKSRDMVQIAAFAAIIAVSAWITVPAYVPFTMQTFAVFLAAGVLGAKKGTLAVLVYILLGVLGLPVFSGGRAGLGVLFGETGGYIIGFVPAVYLCGRLNGVLNCRFSLLVSMLSGLLIIYGLGILWFWLVYAQGDEAKSLLMIASGGILPFIVPDLIKIALATMVAGQLKRRTNLF
jgi:biotin transport system substrate-specific component